MYERSLLVLRAFSDRRTGAVAAAARDGWAYVWPRDAATAALAFAAAGYRDEARRVARFLLRLSLTAGARFDGDGTPIAGREAQGDAWGWTALAARATGLPYPSPVEPVSTTPSDPPREGPASPPPGFWRDRADYQEKSPGLFLGNALASFPHSARDGHESINQGGTSPVDGGPSSVDGPETGTIGRFAAHQREGERIRRLFEAGGVLVREAGSGSGVGARSGADSAAAWAVRPFRQPSLFPLARRTLHRLIAERGGRYGIVPSADWPEDDPWTAPTAAAAWAFAALAHERVIVRRGDQGVIVGRGDRRKAAAGERLAAAGRDRRAALDLLTRLRRAATATGVFPERVDAETGVPRSATPLAWSHAFAILALGELWPSGPASRPAGPRPPK